MCGILGYFSSREKIEDSDFSKSLEYINHRGPDDTGIIRHNSLRTALQGFKRLSIIDLSPGGHQPMVFKNLSITFNGELYNYIEIREELIQKNYTFDSNSDTEVILKAFHFWGNAAVEKFNGMFAIAIYNNTNRELTIIRDRVGIKPIYFYWDEQKLIYSSEVKPILAFPNIKKTINSESIFTFLVNGFIPAPNTIFGKIKILQPGSILTFKNNNIEIHTYWSISNKFQERVLSQVPENEIKDSLDKLIDSSVRYRMISDVPIGSFLSGGIDSSLVSSIMQKNSSKPINTFSIGFKESSFNEANFAKEISKHIGSNHHELYISLNDAKEFIPEMIRNFDIPFGDSSAIPMMIVSELAKKYVTVALSGDGGDELFCGYKLYDKIKDFQKYSLISKIFKPFRNSLLNQKFILDKYKYLNLFFASNNVEIINSGNLVSLFYLKDLISGKNGVLDNTLFENSNFSENIQESNMILNMKTYLPDDILKKVDISSMASSLEARVPLLDHRIIEYSFTIPHELKYMHGDKKYILKQLLYDYVPKELIDRPKKGFSVPIFDWLHQDLSYLIDEYLNDSFIISQKIFNRNIVNSLKQLFIKQPKNYFINNIIWNLLVFQMWYKQNLS